jgi:hypothetical protein
VGGEAREALEIMRKAAKEELFPRQQRFTFFDWFRAHSVHDGFAEVSVPPAPAISGGRTARSRGP